MVKQTDAFQGSGIAADMFKKLFEFLEGGNGIQDHIVTIGKGANQAILSDVPSVHDFPGVSEFVRDLMFVGLL